MRLMVEEGDSKMVYILSRSLTILTSVSLEACLANTSVGANSVNTCGIVKTWVIFTLICIYNKNR